MSPNLREERITPRSDLSAGAARKRTRHATSVERSVTRRRPALRKFAQDD
jgi:hypothetical protein